MKTPRYCDGRYENGYTRAAATDVRKTFRRIRAEQAKAAEQAAKDEQERQAKVRRMGRAHMSAPTFDTAKR